MTSTLDREVAEFAAAVRRALGDLPAEVVDDLTDGLEADLTERSLDDGEALGDPGAYAAELRAAAGLADRRGPALLDGVGAEIRRLPARAAEIVRQRRREHPALDRAIDFVVALRPLWWVLRAWLVYLPIGGVLGGPLPATPVEWLVLAALLVVSVQFGRGRWLPHRWMRAALTVVNVAAAIAAPFALAWLPSAVRPLYDTASYSGPDYSSSGLMLDGSSVTNLFAYDAQGHPLTDVQIFTQDGRPLDAVGDPTQTTSGDDGAAGILVPNADVAGRPGWNVYPLHELAPDQLGDDGLPRPDAITRLPQAPFGSVKPLLVEPVPSASPIPSASPAP